MSGIAEVLHHQGFPVSGSDLAESETVRKLRALGLKVHQGHHAENIENATVVVVSSAVGNDNPEVVEAKRKGIPIGIFAMQIEQGKEYLKKGFDMLALGSDIHHMWTAARASLNAVGDLMLADV